MEKKDEKKVVKQELNEEELEQATGAGLYCESKSDCKKLLGPAWGYFWGEPIPK